jgi:hypothetical protein
VHPSQLEHDESTTPMQRVHAACDAAAGAVATGLAQAAADSTQALQRVVNGAMRAGAAGTEQCSRPSCVTQEVHSSHYAAPVSHLA